MAQRQVPATVAPIRISSTRTRVDDRLPVVGFNVWTADLPFFEVILAADPALFAASNSSARTPANWYASRQDVGLQPATGAPSIFIVPSAVLQAFANATPKPSRIYYTAAGYKTRSGEGGVYAHDPSELQSEAPFIEVASDFRGATLAGVRGIQPDRLRRLTGKAASENGAAAPSVTSPAAPPRPAETPAPAVDAAADRVEGEDGYGQPPETLALNRAPLSPELHAADHGPAEPSRNGAGRGAGTWRGHQPPAYPQSRAAASTRSYDDSNGYSDYDDGYAGPIPEPVPLPRAQPGRSLQAPASSTGRARADKPYALDEDDETARGPQKPTRRGYGDEADEARQFEGERIEDDEFDLEYEPLDGRPTAASLTSATAVPLEVQDKREIIEAVAAVAGSSPYTRIIGANGRCDPGRVSFGIGRFELPDGSMYKLMSRMQERDPEMFRQLFPDINPAMRQDLPMCDRSFLERLGKSGSHKPYQAAQNQVASEYYLDPLLPFCRDIGLTSDRALAIAHLLAVELGPEGAENVLASAAGPVPTAALRQQALAALGHTTVAGFQSSSGLEPTGECDPRTHAALTRALRALGPASPVPVSDLHQMLSAIERYAANQPFAERIGALLRSNALTDRTYTF
jgi:hypothetical protein